MNGGRPLIVGIGSDFGDDRLGWVAAERLAERFPSADIRKLRSPLDLFNCIADVEHLHVVDACQGAGPPGTIVCRDWPDAMPEVVRFSGTHDFGLVATLQLAERLQQLPPRVTIWGAEAIDTRRQQPATTPLSPPVAAAVEVLTDRIAAKLGLRVIAAKAIHHA